MLKVILSHFFLSFFFIASSFGMKYKGHFFKEIRNDVNVVFVDTTKSDDLLVAICVSSGIADERNIDGISLLLSEIICCKIKKEVNSDDSQRGSIVEYSCGYDNTVYYVYSKLDNFEKILKIVGKAITAFAVTSDELSKAKKTIISKLRQDSSIDKVVASNEARKSLYWHSKYGSSATQADIEKITVNDLYDFKKHNYTNNRITLICAGNVNKSKVLSDVAVNFCFQERSVIDRLMEPLHHDATVRLTSTSSQIHVPIIEMYWNIPCYRNDQKRAAAIEVFINYLKCELHERIVDRLHIASDICISYDMWNYMYGDMRLSVTIAAKDDIEFAITSMITEISSIVNEDIPADKVEAARSNVIKTFPKSGDEIFETINWFAQKNVFSMNNNLSWSSDIKSVKSEFISKEAKSIFKKAPRVISVIKPNGSS